MSEPSSYDYHENSVGIIFHLATRRRFIPNAWLTYAELNRNATEIAVHYTHCIVAVEGANLGHLHELIGKFGLSWVRELPRMPGLIDATVTRIEITEESAR
jgi:hypothetical protein